MKQETRQTEVNIEEVVSEFRQLKTLPLRQQEFFDFILQYYTNNGYTELGDDRLGVFVNIKYGNSPTDALRLMGLTVAELRDKYLLMQVNLYDSLHVHGNYIENQKIERQYNN